MQKMLSSAYIAMIALFLFAAVVQCIPTDAQGLVGSPIDVRYGPSDEPWQLAEYGYDNARDAVAVVTSLAVAGSLAILLIQRIRDRKKIDLLRSQLGSCSRQSSNLVRDSIVEFFLVLVVPLLVYQIGMFAINNYGGLCGCCH